MVHYNIQSSYFNLCKYLPTTFIETKIWLDILPKMNVQIMISVNRYSLNSKVANEYPNFQTFVLTLVILIYQGY